MNPDDPGRSPAPRFTPSCPRCRYEVTGLPDGPCPECGRPFRHDELLSAWRTSVWQREINAENLRRVGLAAGVGVLVSQACCAAPVVYHTGRSRRDDPEQAFVIGTAFFVMWLLTRRRARMTGYGWPALMTAAPAVRLIADAGVFPSTWLSAMGVAVVFTVVWAATRGRRAGPLLCAWGATVSALAAPLVSRWLILGQQWSGVPDPRRATAQVYAQYPLRFDEIGWLLVPAAIGGFTLLAFGLLLDARRRALTHRRRPAETAEPAG